MSHAHTLPPQLQALQGQGAGQRRTLVPIQRATEDDERDKKKKKRRGIFSFLKPKDEEPLEIGTPYDYKQHFHVGFDPATGTFQGLPPEWTAMLSSSGISAAEASQHSDSILKVLEFQSRILKNDLPPPPPPAFLHHQLGVGADDLPDEDYDAVCPSSSFHSPPPSVAQNAHVHSSRHHCRCPPLSNAPLPCSFALISPSLALSRSLARSLCLRLWPRSTV